MLKLFFWKMTLAKLVGLLSIVILVTGAQAQSKYDKVLQEKKIGSWHPGRDCTLRICQ